MSSDTQEILFGALFSALRGTVVQLARAENNKSDKFCPFYRAAKELLCSLYRATEGECDVINTEKGINRNG